MNSIADVVAGPVPRSWHEAVAVVQEVAQQVVPGSAVPEAEDVLLDDQGNLSVGFGSEASDNPVVQLAKLLLTLLEGTECPTPLLQLANENSRVPPAHASVASFTRALAFFERPNRASDLAALGGRLSGRRRPMIAASDFRVPEEVPQIKEVREVKEAKEETVEQNLELLKEKVAKAPSPPVVEEKENRSGADPAWVRPASAAAVLAGVALLAGAWLGSRGLSPTAGISSAVETAETKLADVLAEGINRITPVQAASAEPAPTGPVERPQEVGTASSSRANPSTGRVRPSSAGQRPALPFKPSGRAAVPSILSGHDSGAAASAHPALTSPFEVSPVLDLSRVYTSSDAGVEPPRLRRPQLPSQPEPNDETGYFDIVVNEQGRVDEVRLISPSRRYYDRMMVAAAKAWVFQPARLHGQPVKYRTRIPIIGPPPM